MNSIQKIGAKSHFLLKESYFTMGWNNLWRNILIQSNLVIRNFLVTLKLFLNAKCSLSLWSKWQIDHGKWFLNTNLFPIKPFLITKFDCIHKPALFFLWDCKLCIGIIPKYLCHLFLWIEFWLEKLKIPTKMPSAHSNSRLN